VEKGPLFKTFWGKKLRYSGREVPRGNLLLGLYSYKKTGVVHRRGPKIEVFVRKYFGVDDSVMTVRWIG